MLISIVINCDTRSGFIENESTADTMFNGCRSVDFLIDGVQNKINFFKDFEKEVILFIDQHESIPEGVLNTIRGMVDTLVIRKHDKKFGDRKDYVNFNDPVGIRNKEMNIYPMTFNFNGNSKTDNEPILKKT